MKQPLILMWASSISLLTASADSFAHLAVAANVDVGQTIEIESSIKSVIWKNPHLRLSVVIAEGTGPEQLWDIESHTLSNLSTMDMDRSVLISGVPARRKPHSMFVPFSKYWQWQTVAKVVPVDCDSESLGEKT